MTTATTPRGAPFTALPAFLLNGKVGDLLIETTGRTITTRRAVKVNPVGGHPGHPDLRVVHSVALTTAHHGRDADDLAHRHAYVTTSHPVDAHGIQPGAVRADGQEGAARDLTTSDAPHAFTLAVKGEALRFSEGALRRAHEEALDEWGDWVGVC